MPSRARVAVQNRISRRTLALAIQRMAREQILAVIRFLNRRPTKTLLVLTVLIAAVFEASAGGPRHIAGTVSFEPAAKGTPLTWADGTVTYYHRSRGFQPDPVGGSGGRPGG